MQPGATFDGYHLDRIAVVDILRAFALFGIIINHAALSFLAGPAPDPQFNVFSALDQFVNDLAELLTFGKFFAIFSFLFGLSFAIQLDNSTRNGTAFSGRFAWRLALLFAIGFIHSLFFSGDVLMVYALLGLLLIRCRKWKSKTLIVVGLILVFNIPGLFLGLLGANLPPPSAEQREAAVQFQQRFEASAKEQYRIKQSGSVEELVKINATASMVNKLAFLVITGRLWITFGYFLLGLWAGRVALFRETAHNRALFRRLLLWSGIPAAITSAIHLVYPSNFEEATLANALASFSFTVQQTTLAAFLVATLTLAYWRKPSMSVLSNLAATGKMGLTTYLMQSVFGLTVFFGLGFGLLGHVGVAVSVASSIAFFVAQVWFARWWMQRFNMGPVEWLWRSLTYFKIQPNMRARA